ncbi:Unknown protein [Striga hermonthica]|uniref:DUF1985 domain-containing protein n=1 Tax=Striga hermonthica TaxID=68872 RepID=A0A9N7MR13_STRHE|nr:Unknown protein [Striga hermonthica]
MFHFRTKKEYAFDISSKCKAVGTNRCNLKVVREVFDKLDDAHKDRFVESCFRQLINILELILSLLVHQVLRRTLKASENDKDAVWFRFGEKEARFGLQEFCLVTGFKMAANDENAYEVPKYNSLLLQLFKEKKGKIKRNDLLEKFHELDNEEDAETKYKLGLVTVLEHVVLSAECETLVDERWFNLVEDLEKFNSYPWGNLSYQQTLKLFQRTSFGKGKNPKSIKYSLHGFPLAIMIEVRRTLEPCSYEVESSYVNDLGIIAQEEDSVRQDEDGECTATKVEEEGSASSKADDDDDVDDEEEEKDDEEEEEEKENASQPDPPQPHVLDAEYIRTIVREVVTEVVKDEMKRMEMKMEMKMERMEMNMEMKMNNFFDRIEKLVFQAKDGPSTRANYDGTNVDEEVDLKINMRDTETARSVDGVEGIF